MTARLEISRLAPDLRRTIAVDGPVVVPLARSTRLCRKGVAFPERDRDGGPRQRLRGRATSGSTEGVSWSHAALSECGAGRAYARFPSFKPLNYHKTAKYSCAVAAEDASAESPR